MTHVAPGTAAMTAAPRILVVDDDVALHAVLARTIARTGYDVVFTESGAEGLTLAGKLDPAVIVLDLRMPNMDGHTFLRRLASLDLDAAVVVTSGTGEMDDVIEVLRHGAVDYVRKPWDPTELRAALARAIEIHATRSSSGGTSILDAAATPASPSIFSELLARIQRGDIVLPSVPSIVEELRTIVAGRDSTIGAVTKLVAQDQALVTRVLQLGRSAQYAAFKPGDLESTVGRIGFQTLHALVETVWLNGCFQSRDPRFAAYTDRLARFGLARAVAMRAFAAPAKLAGSTAYFAGLLADVGALFLLYVLGEKAGSVPDPETCLTLIRQHHESIGAQLLAKWGHRDDVAQRARVHHGHATLARDAYAKLFALGTVTACEMLGEDDLTGDSPSRDDAERCAHALGIEPALRRQRADAAATELAALREAR
jgi:CheY-like chemotaxis protein/HD-like signal output (HDOD) protein